MIYMQWQQDGQTHQKSLDPSVNLLIGRHQTCDIVLDNPHISRQHAQIQYLNDRLEILNRSQNNKVQIITRNGSVHVLAFQQSYKLRVGTIFRIADVEFSVQGPEPEQLKDSSSFKIICPECNRPIPATAIFCPYDGAGLANGVSLKEIDEE